MSTLHIDLEKDDLAAQIKLLQHICIVRGTSDAHLHLTDGEAPIPPRRPEHQQREGNPFAGNAVPQPPAAPSAPSTAGAAPPPIAPAAPQASSAHNMAPPAPPAPPASVAATQAPALSDEVDSSGLPYDARIHNDGKTKKVDGTWKIKKGLDRNYAATVEAELRSRLQTRVAAAPTSPSTGAPPPPPNLQAPASTGMGFKDFLKKVMTLVTAGTLTQDQVNKCCAEENVVLTMLPTQPHLIEKVNARIDALLIAS